MIFLVFMLILEIQINPATLLDSISPGSLANETARIEYNNSGVTLIGDNLIGIAEVCKPTGRAERGAAGP